MWWTGTRDRLVVDGFDELVDVMVPPSVWPCLPSVASFGVVKLRSPLDDYV